MRSEEMVPSAHRCATSSMDGDVWSDVNTGELPRQVKQCKRFPPQVKIDVWINAIAVRVLRKLNPFGVTTVNTPDVLLTGLKI